MAGGRHDRGRLILMTVDAVGGVWRHAMDLAAGLRACRKARILFVGLGPEPAPDKVAEAEAIGRLLWLDLPLDWMAGDAGALLPVPERIASIARSEGADIVHLNLPSQAAGLSLPVPVVTVSHSCVVTWFAGVRGHGLPDHWAWQERLNRAGFDCSDAVLAPSRSHAAMLKAAYGPIPHLAVVLNGSACPERHPPKDEIVFSAGRWWDDGKNGAVLDRAAPQMVWPLHVAGATLGPNGQALAFSHARHLGELSHRRTMAEMERAGIVVSPSTYEPFGLAALEAARAGAALVLSDIPTYRELWDGAALFADPADPGAFALAVNRLAESEALRTDLARAARLRARRYTVDAQAEAVSRLHDRLLGITTTQTAAE
ncbi:glycosyltransferase family 4 protein [Gellertiella hungarica]|uniref:Glycosyltransferase involved in cell wall biosynthesis n=1 Tax=Gellertiella hungarica TaxID=1572859 RepID=A0A7W6J7A0_9HYPH|nr:glycosyltransferase involved in cell wall biosynthesis [Gellertiella hungarica]